MIGTAVLIWAAQTATVPPPVVVDVKSEPSNIPAIGWKCETALGSAVPLSISGRFPAVSAEDQKTGASFHFRATVNGAQRPDFTGSFPAGLTGDDLMGMTLYSVMIPDQTKREARYVINFEFFRGARAGFVNVVEFDPRTGDRVPFATALCSTQVIQ